MVEIGDEATQLWPGPRGIKRAPVSIGCECEAVQERDRYPPRAARRTLPIDAFSPPTPARSFKLTLSNQRTWGALAIRFLEIAD
jgi:hypothetical protein